MDDSSGGPTRRDLLRAGTAGAGLLAASGQVAAAESGGGGGGETHTVEMGTTSFEPADVTVAPGDTVVWKNTSAVTHSVTAYEDDLPEGATYFASGGFESESAATSGYPQEGALEAGDSFEHTFQTTGEFPYFCIPHEGAGMTGTVTVEEGANAGGGPVEPVLSEGAKALGVAATGGMVSVLGLAYLFVKYGAEGRTVEDA